MYSADIFLSQLGLIELIADDEALYALYFVQSEERYKNRLYRRLGLQLKTGELIPFRRTAATTAARQWLQAYFAGRVPDAGAEIPLCLKGTDFQLRVWESLWEIPRGDTISYQELAQCCGAGFAQAVGQAVGANPLQLILPCHRVIKSDGSPGGYAAGKARKEALLRFETTAEPLAWGCLSAAGGAEAAACAL